jgi:UDP:flavonoid glycosyltransferase YjiC (YdhE family)
MLAIARALRPRGKLVVWSADPDDDFAARLAAAGLAVQSHRARASGGGGVRSGRGARHTLFVAGN